MNNGPGHDAHALARTIHRNGWGLGQYGFQPAGWAAYINDHISFDRIMNEINSWPEESVGFAQISPDLIANYIHRDIALSAALRPLPFANHRNEIERQIIVQLVRDLLAAGYKIQVNDGEEDVTDYLDDEAKIFAAMSTTDEERLFVAQPGGRTGWVWLIYGNDADVISDYTCNLESVLTGAEAVAERFS